MYKFLASLLCFSCADAMDNCSQPLEWYEGEEIECIYAPAIIPAEWHSGVLCSDKEFTEELKSIGLSEQEIAELQTLPLPPHIPLPLSEKGEPQADLSRWFSIKESEAGMLENPEDQHIIATNYIIMCVGMAIVSPQATVLAHVTEDDTINIQRMEGLIEKISLQDRQDSTVILVSGCYSENFSKAYKFLKKCGFSKFFLDIGPLIWGDTQYYIKASAVDADLNSRLGAPLASYKNRGLLKLERDLQKLISLCECKALIINAKTGVPYSIKPQSGTHLIVDMLEQWEEKHQLFSNFPNNRFYLKDLEEKYNAEHEPDRDKTIKTLSGILRNEGASMEQLKEWIASSNLLGFNPWKKD